MTKYYAMLLTCMITHMLCGAAYTESSQSGSKRSIPSLQATIIWSLIQKELAARNRQMLKNYKALSSYFCRSGVSVQITVDILSEITKAYYLHLRSRPELHGTIRRDILDMPVWLQNYFDGISLQDLINRNLVRTDLQEKPLLDREYLTDLDGFANLPGIAHLTSLSLAYNNLTSQALAHAEGLDQLQGLELSNNYIQKLQSGVFSRLTNLRGLTISEVTCNPERNYLLEIEPGAFNGLTRLQTLIISYMPLTVIRANTFIGLDNLITLHLSYNPNLLTFEPGAFNGLHNVQYVNLQCCGIKYFFDEPGLSAETRERIRAEMAVIAPNAIVSFLPGE